MSLQNRRRHLRRDFTFDRVADRLSLALVRHGADDRAALHNLSHAHRDSLLRHVIKRRKPAFTQLLSAAGFIELHNQVRLLGFEICRRIVEREMPILANSDKRDVSRMSTNNFANPSALGLRVALTIEKMERPQRQRQLAHKTLPQIAAK